MHNFTKERVFKNSHFHLFWFKLAMYVQPIVLQAGSIHKTMIILKNLKKSLFTLRDHYCFSFFSKYNCKNITAPAIHHPSYLIIVNNYEKLSFCPYR